MAEKPKYVGFGELHKLDQEADRRSAKTAPEVKHPVTSGSQNQENGPHNEQVVDSHKTDFGSHKTDFGSHKTDFGSHNEQVVDSHKTDFGSHNEQPAKTKYKADRHALGTVRVSIRYTQDFHKEMKDFCTANGLQIQDLHELAIVYYMKAVGSHKTQVVGSHNMNLLAPTNADVWEPHDDLMIFKTHDDIIMRYERLTGRKWKVRDDRAAMPFNNVDHRLIEIGMIHTYIQAKGKKINSFAYFIPEIQTMIDANFDRSNLDVYLKARRKLLINWMKKQGKEPITFWDSEEQKQKG